MEISLGSICSSRGQVFVRDGFGNGSPRGTQMQEKVGSFAPAQKLVSIESADPEVHRVFRTRRTPTGRETRQEQGFPTKNYSLEGWGLLRDC
jgi:hypothetical protein